MLPSASANRPKPRHAPRAPATQAGQSRRGAPPSAAPRFDLRNPEILALVRRIFFSRFSRRVEAAGIELDDALQNIFVGLLERSARQSKWDPSRGALSTWLYVAIQGMVMNMADKARRKRWLSVGHHRDAVESYDEAAPEPITASTLDELADEMGVPPQVVTALVDGGDLYEAALRGGCSVTEATDIVKALSGR